MNKQSAGPSRTKTSGLSFITGVKITALVLIIVACAVLPTIHLFKVKLEDRQKELEQQALELEQENQQLEEYLDNKNTDEGVKDVAQDQMGMVDPDAIIYDFD